MGDIKVGDYIEFKEPSIFGNDGTPHTMRLVVDRITIGENNIPIYWGRADDSYNGARGTMVKDVPESEIKVITNEVPFTNWYITKILRNTPLYSELKGTLDNIEPINFDKNDIEREE